MRFDWEHEYPNNEVRENVQIYLGRWEDFKESGMGIEFYSPTLGTGKTAGAAHIGKTLIKQGEKVFFSQFSTLFKKILDKDKEYEERLKSATLLIIDDILPAVSGPQQNLFAAQLEEVVRDRTNWDMPTITTTNLTQEQMAEGYPRIYSLLSPKQQYIPMPGSDARLGVVRDMNNEKAALGERAPIT